ncbi:FAD-binding oxidoreductase [Novosphingopyxis sp.]|uniref:FAD-binding oxidoreductase n=1 Tax=Novosphingopyxis sp. TaxID=2709690 RepID=UPI003B5997CF
MNEDLRASFSRLLGLKGYTEDAAAMAPWLTDWRGRYHGAAAAMVSPGSTRDVAATVKLCAEHGIAIVPQGGNSGMVAGATPDQSGKAVLLSLRRMDMVDRSRIDEGLILCGAGVILQNLHDELAAVGRRFPLTLGGKGSATVGGLVSTNAGGTQVLRHGTMRALVAGLEAVLPDGSVIDGTAALKKDNRGYDLQQLFVGAEGTLGIVTRAVLKTAPALIDRCVAWIGLDSPHTAYRLLLFLSGRGAERLEGFEIIPGDAVAATLAHLPGARPPLKGKHRWHVLAEWVQDRPDQAPPRALAETLLANAIAQGLVEDAALSSSESQAEDFWRIRDSISEAERALGPALQHDVSVPVGRMPDFIERASRTIERDHPGTQAVAFGHLGDGNIHFHVRAPGDVEPEHWYASEGGAISAQVYDMVDDYGGSISAEHGIGQAKLGELARLTPPARLDALVAIKRALDPKNIMNPGKILSLHD